MKKAMTTMIRTMEITSVWGLSLKFEDQTSCHHDEGIGEHSDSDGMALAIWCLSNVENCEGNDAGRKDDRDAPMVATEWRRQRQCHVATRRNANQTSNAS